MKSDIELNNVSLKFRLHHNKSPSLKELFVNFLSKEEMPSAYDDFWALKNINLRIKHGQRVGIIGHNGAGKSTLLKLLCRIYEPTNGKVNIIGGIAPLLEIGAGFNPELSGRENIYLNGAILGYTKKFLREIEEEIIVFAGLTEFIDNPVKYYSTGMYMRLAFAVATAVKPDILILDELFAGGDAEFIEKAQKRMKEMIEDSNIMVFVSHQMELLQELCNRVIWLEHGMIIGDGEPSEIISRYLEK